MKRKIMDVIDLTDDDAGGVKSAKVVDTRITKLTRQVNALTKAQELKTHDVTFAATQIDYDTDHATSLSVVPAGDSNIQRDGSKIFATSIHIRMTCRQETTPASFGSSLRVILIKSKQRFVPKTEVSTTTSGVLQNAGTVNSVISPFERNNRTHFVVLHDKMYYINGGDSGPTGFNIEIRKKLGHIIKYEGVSTTLEAGGMWMLLMSNRAAASADGGEVAFTSRLYFRDS